MRNFRFLTAVLFFTLSLPTIYYLLPTGFLPQAHAQEEFTITTYYPSPYGSYNSLQTDKLGVGDNDGVGGLTSADVPTTSGDVWIRGNVGIGTTGPRAPLALNTNSFPYPNATYIPQSPQIISNGSILTRNSLRNGTQLYIGGGATDVSNPSYFIAFAGMGIGHNTLGDTDTASFLTFNTSFDNIFAERMRIDRTGSVGIGTTAPQAVLDVAGDVILGGGATSNETGRMRWDSSYFGGNDDALIIEKIDDDPTIEGGLVFGFSASSGIDTPKTSPGWGVNFSPSMVIEGSGNVGIGTTNPQGPLHVVDDPSPSVRPHMPSVLIERQSALSCPGCVDTTPRLGLVDTAVKADGSLTGGSAKTSPTWFIDNVKDSFRIYRQSNIDTAGSTFFSIDKDGITSIWKQKLCSCYITGNWRDSILVPAYWTATTCQSFCTTLGGSYQLGCIFKDSYSIAGAGNPSPNCGW